MTAGPFHLPPRVAVRFLLLTAELIFFGDDWQEIAGFVNGFFNAVSLWIINLTVTTATFGQTSNSGITRHQN